MKGDLYNNTYFNRSVYLNGPFYHKVHWYIDISPITDKNLPEGSRKCPSNQT